MEAMEAMEATEAMEAMEAEVQGPLQRGVRRSVVDVASRMPVEGEAIFVRTPLNLSRLKVNGSNFRTRKFTKKL